ncbi:hypothetical protein STRATTON_85 [Erwinia phage vB_EamM_Stratton]|uniref:Uncharacterized protein n=1 Tax=Erwinia phage vB_EamM_Stratton TaxID=1883378 RepID=A0A1B2IGW1_9CAUD|nr:hypothetical protein STRATTON_85 [Erwinia phage vB_EamM_Stratton]
MTDAEINFTTPLTFKRITLAIIAVVVVLLSPFVVTDVTTYLTGSESLGELIGGLWSVLLVATFYFGWDTLLLNHLRTNFTK